MPGTRPGMTKDVFEGLGSSALRLVVLDIGEAHVVGGRAFERAAFVPGCQWTTSSIFLASAKSLSVMPLAAWFISLTSTQA